MTMPRWIAFFLLLSGVALAQTQPADEVLASSSLSGTEATQQSYIDGLVEAMMREHRIPGLIVAVTDGEEDRLIAGYGQADVDPDRAVDGSETLFRIGSISKTFTWTAVMMLVDRGQLDLDRDINDYLVDLTIQEAFDTPVTMNDLMAHRAGFEDTLRVFQLSDDDPRSLAEVLAETQPARVFPPGARTSYSNWGSALAAHIVEVVDGRPYIEILNADILQPLGMDSTTLVAPSLLDPDWAERMALGLQRAAGRLEPSDPMQIGAFAPAGGMASTASDMARWMRFHLNGGTLDGVRLMSESTHARMLSRHFNDRPGAADLAHGFQTFPVHGVTVFGHAGSTGDFQSRMLFVPELDFGVFASQNSGSGGYAAVNALTELLIERGIEAAGGAIEAPPYPTDSGEDLAPYAGAYRNNRRGFETLTAAFSIAPTLSVLTAEDGSLIVQQAGESDRYVPVTGSEDVFRNDLGQVIHFQRDASGAVVAVNDSSGVHSHERIPARGQPWALILPFLLALGLSVTTLLGFWKRWRLPGRTTHAGRRAAWRAWFAALGMLIYTLIGIVAVIAVSQLDASTIRNFPPTALIVFTAAGWVLLLITAVLLTGLIPAWRGSDWPLRRRLHFTAFALTLSALCAQLWYWNLFGAAII
jgi:CubicO group peptidase (beta-lactamase class C family)